MKHGNEKALGRLAERLTRRTTEGELAAHDGEATHPIAKKPADETGG